MTIEDKLIDNYQIMVKKANHLIWDDKLIKLDFRFKKLKMLQDDVNDMLQDLTEWEKELKQYMNNLKRYLRNGLGSEIQKLTSNT